tara:strand:+ start:9458 stop:10078 length:621 start_codon:yes stop_codon:yes gene_type:complete
MKKLSLLRGIGNKKETENYYDKWALTYDDTLKKWNYKAPEKAVKFIIKQIQKKPKYILDLACGTGLFAKQIKIIYPSSIIDGVDISAKILKIARNTNLYRYLFKTSFEKKIKLKNKYDLISLIGAMTYCNKPKKLFENVISNLNTNSFFVFTQRIDLWESRNFDNILDVFNSNLKLIFKSRPLNYLPRNNDFKKHIKIRIVIMKKI